MRILYRPKVYLIARPNLVGSGIKQFLEDQKLTWPTDVDGVTDAEILTELAGRCCYMSFGKDAKSKTNAAYIRNLIGFDRSGPAHGSVVEHACFSFIVVGAGRGYAHEQTRHRAGWSYSELSTRYCDFERSEVEEGSWEPGFCIPPLAQLTESTRDFFEDRLKLLQGIYVGAVDGIKDDLVADPSFQKELEGLSARDRDRVLRKAARGAARELLPNATEAIMVMSANARALWNTIYLRASPEAEAVIRDVYVQICRIMQREMPALFQGVVYGKCWDGSEYVTLPREHI